MGVQDSLKLDEGKNYYATVHVHDTDHSGLTSPNKHRHAVQHSRGLNFRPYHSTIRDDVGLSVDRE